MKKIGIALGGGGAKGLAHVLMLEALDEFELRPSYVTGTRSAPLSVSCTARD